MQGLDAWITSGRYSRSLVDVTCPACGEKTTVTAETEYGATEWTPCECSSCGAEFPDDAEFVDAEPDDPDCWYDDPDA